MSFVSFERGFNLHIGLPEFKSSVPADRGEVGGDLLAFSGVVVFGGVLDLRDPFLVVDEVLVLSRFGSGGVFDISQSVPQINFLFGSGRQNLSVVGRESNGKYLFLVPLE